MSRGYIEIQEHTSLGDTLRYSSIHGSRGYIEIQELTGLGDTLRYRSIQV